MENNWIQFHLQESKEELDSIVQNFSNLNEGDFGIGMKHLYHHLNTAFNSRNIDDNECFEKCGDEDFYRSQEKFPDNLF